ncbi:hypothetical protein VCRA2113O118_20313 [Vibrio crassostreae]|nr:hypothetical protein VCRA2113O119_10312 [Vibrio crassostreae]CAK1960115.1 hypothetical protein VCRA2110O113_20094 [Vibrio crassostreae]CAK1962421.1 hypothetical protein VCRA2113O120_20094 [Vibrio crassostreae]CAK1980735.1 hypothetical protein VCRA2114E123_20312 [Vibrio crassostreae]CAK2317821.1 hypothetical protein VCRA2112O114_20093 [Vibrio crassostreae]
MSHFKPISTPYKRQFARFFETGDRVTFFLHNSARRLFC